MNDYYAPIAGSPRDYWEKKHGRGMSIADAKKHETFLIMEAFEAGEKSELVARLHLFEEMERVLRQKGYSENGYLRSTLNDLIRDAKRFKDIDDNHVRPKRLDKDSLQAEIVG